MKLGFRSNLVANFTLNTDFADADVDTLQFNLTPYKLFFPEKRQFFLENAGVFNFALGGDSGDLVFFSRQIGIDPITGEEVPINGGGKVTGSLDGFELGAIDVETQSSGPNPYANCAIARVKRYLWGAAYSSWLPSGTPSPFRILAGLHVLAVTQVSWQIASLQVRLSYYANQGLH